MQYEAPCPHCGQLIFVDAPEGADDVEIQRKAQELCSCGMAKFEQMRIRNGNKLKEFAENEFKDAAECKGLMVESILALQNGSFDKITLKRGRKTYSLDLDKDGFIRVKSKYAENTETKF